VPSLSDLLRGCPVIAGVKKISFHHVPITEALALREGLCSTTHLNLTKVQVECDSKLNFKIFILFISFKKPTLLQMQLVTLTGLVEFGNEVYLFLCFRLSILFPCIQYVVEVSVCNFFFLKN
jgi:hypothetical protein